MTRKASQYKMGRICVLLNCTTVLWLVCAGLSGNVAAHQHARYEPNWKSLDSRPLPQWFDDDKFGIFIHWFVFPFAPRNCITLNARGDICLRFEFTEHDVSSFLTGNNRLAPVPFRGVYSVPSWGPVGQYAEWYGYFLGQSGSPTQEFHNRTFGPDFPYTAFAPMWKAELFDADQWADIIVRSGAKYVVPTSKVRIEK